MESASRKDLRILQAEAVTALTNTTHQNFTRKQAKKSFSAKPKLLGAQSLTQRRVLVELFPRYLMCAGD